MSELTGYLVVLLNLKCNIYKIFVQSTHSQTLETCIEVSSENFWVRGTKNSQIPKTHTHPLLEIKKAIQTPMLIQNSVYPDKKSEVKVLELHNDVRITANKLLVWQKVKYVHIAVNS